MSAAAWLPIGLTLEQLQRLRAIANRDGMTPNAWASIAVAAALELERGLDDGSTT